MPNGFPEGKFRIVNVETGQCLYKKTGVGGTLGKPGPPWPRSHQRGGPDAERISGRKVPHRQRGDGAVPVQEDGRR
ncbi:hypothetical protein ACFZB6_25280, partial [Streptomyces syringium]|uniref:hypothetical protein n=1 Tax=Streptomyces syringium TaxID=76729 RepID=UPI0036E49B39